jgi:hypothetical protein
MNRDDLESVQQWKSELEIHRSKQAQVNKMPSGSSTRDVGKRKKIDLDAAVDRLEEKIRNAEE